MGRFRRAAPFIVIVLILALPALEASGALGPLNDLLALGEAGGQEPARAPTARRAEPPLVATPRAVCGPGSKPEPGIQGRVPAGSAEGGLHCNVDLVAHQGTSGGFKVLRYVDPAGHECAFYDTALLFPVNALKLDTTSAGVAVLDMSDPAHPVQTATLTEDVAARVAQPQPGARPAGRGARQPVDLPGAGLDLRRPQGLPAPGAAVDQAGRPHRPRERLLARRQDVLRGGHRVQGDHRGRRDRPEAAARALAGQRHLARDDAERRRQARVRRGHRRRDADPRRQRDPGAQGRSAGARDQPADLEGGLDPAERDPVQPRRQALRARVRRVHQGTTGSGDKDAVGAARIIDIADERAPRVVANLRLQVNQPADHAAASSDPGASSPVQGYAAHYCSLSSEVDPTVVACSFITSGLRVFDISDLLHPKEIAYYVAPTQPRAENEFMASDFAMSKPAIVPSRREVWYSDGATGFNVLRVAQEVWPGPAGGGAGSSRPAGRGCLSRSAAIGRRGIGRVRLGMTRKALARRLPAPRQTTKRSWRWCVKGGKGAVSVAFAKSRVALVATTAARGGKGNVVPGSSAARMRRRYPHRTALGRRVFRAGPHSTRVLGVRGGKVRYVAVTASRTIARPKLLRGYLHAAGVRPR